MTFADEIDDHKSRCRQYLLRLRILARSPDDAALSRELTAEIREATNAIIAEAEDMGRAAVLAVGEHDPQAETFVWVRIARLAAAAHRAVGPAHSRDISGLRAHLGHFDALTSAIWTVERAVYGQQAVPRQRVRELGGS